MLKRFFLLPLLFTFFVFKGVQAQEHNDHQNNSDHSSSHHEKHKNHSITASVNHSVIFNAIKDGESAGNITLPSFGLNYTYFFNEKWAIGLHNDIIIEDFIVKEGSSGKSDDGQGGDEIQIIERGTPVAACIMGIYKPLPYLGLMAGFGREFSSHQDFTVIRFGLEAPYHLPNNWELFGILTYDINIDAYQSLTYGIGFGKLF